uniref:rRNA N-glycosylase n=1 Tax=Oryza punctata TaxID=4537 RepID=A0A0E0KHF0_ORYPU
MSTSTVITAVFLLYLVSPVQSVEFFKSVGWAPYHVLDYDFFRNNYYVNFHMFRNDVISTSSQLQVDNNYILSEQTPNQAPVAWKMGHLIGRGDDNAMLSIRADNLYVTGFANKTGHWHVYPKFANQIPEPKTVLTFGDDYKSLLGEDASRNLPKINLGRHVTLNVIETLSNYKPSLDDTDIKIALATLIVTLPEAVRFRPIRYRLMDGWFTGTCLTSDLAKEVVSWRDLSCGVLICDKYGRWWGNFSHDPPPQPQTTRRLTIPSGPTRAAFSGHRRPAAAPSLLLPHRPLHHASQPLLDLPSPHLTAAPIPGTAAPQLLLPGDMGRMVLHGSLGGPGVSTVHAGATREGTRQDVGRLDTSIAINRTGKRTSHAPPQPQRTTSSPVSQSCVPLPIGKLPSGFRPPVRRLRSSSTTSAISSTSTRYTEEAMIGFTGFYNVDILFHMIPRAFLGLT